MVGHHVIQDFMQSDKENAHEVVRKVGWDGVGGNGLGSVAGLDESGSKHRFPLRT